MLGVDDLPVILLQAAALRVERLSLRHVSDAGDRADGPSGVTKEGTVDTDTIVSEFDGRGHLRLTSIGEDGEPVTSEWMDVGGDEVDEYLRDFDERRVRGTA
jgi:hypothetical protein